MSRLRQVRKRDGRLVPFQREKVAEAIFRAAQSVGGHDRFLAEQLAGVVASQLERLVADRPGAIPSIEDVQDTVERILIEAGHARTAKSYILYRDRRTQARARRDEARRADGVGRHLLVDRPVAGSLEEGPLEDQGFADQGIADQGIADQGFAAAAGAMQIRPAGGPAADAPFLPSDTLFLPRDTLFLPRDTLFLPPDPADPGARRWSKLRIADVLTEREGIPRHESEAIARAVEEQVLASGLPRISESLLLALVRTECFSRGRVTRLGEATSLGVAAEQVEALLAAPPEGRRTDSPAATTEAIGEHVVREHVLGRHLPPAVAEAVRLGDLTCYDLGQPLRLSALAVDAIHEAERQLAADEVSHAAAARRAVGALIAAIEDLVPFVGRHLHLEGVNVFLAPFLAHLDEDALGDEIRLLLMHPALRPGGLRGVARRGGLLQIELGLTVDVQGRKAPGKSDVQGSDVQGSDIQGREVSGRPVPCNHMAREVPSPAAPGRTYGDHAEAALRVARAILREHLTLYRQGYGGAPAAVSASGVRLALALPREEPDPALEALVDAALRTAAECGEPEIVFHDASSRPAGGRWLRLRPSEVADPLRFEGSAPGAREVCVASAVAINLAGAAIRTHEAGTSEFLREVDRLVQLAMESASARRRLHDGASAAPGTALHTLRKGMHPRVDLESASHLLELVGLDRAVVLLSRRVPSAPGEAVTVDGSASREALRLRIVNHVHQRVVQEAAARRLTARLVLGLSEEAATRFARLDAERYEGVSGWWEPGDVPTYGTDRRLGVQRGDLRLRRIGDGSTWVRVLHRVDGEKRPPLSLLRASFDAAREDETVEAYGLEPWPRRVVHRRRGVRGEMV